ncbi:MAG: MBL fold metallo-hydrolase [Clostridia bacterium]|nr:MBL fold metallo-hydrolase [Clostridia bacterium]
MYELIKVTESCYYIQCPSKIGIVKLSDSEVFLVDSGNDKDTGKRVLKILEANGWRLKFIVNTHSHADHTGGNRFLQERTGCKIYAPEIECSFVTSPILEPAFLWAGNPFPELRNKFLMAQECRAQPLSSDVLPEGFEIISLKGHFFNMIGIRTPDDVVFLADSYSSKETLDKYRISFLYDVREYLDTLEYLKGIKAKSFIPSHAEVSENIGDILQYNIDCTAEMADKICELIAVPVCFEKLLKMLFDEYGLTLSAQQYVLAGSTVRSYLTYLKNNGRADFIIENNMLLWKAV